MKRKFCLASAFLRGEQSDAVPSYEGTITAIFTDTLTRTVTITTRPGQSVTFLVTPQTQIRPLGTQLGIGLRVQVQVEWDVVLDKWKALRLTRR